MARVTGVKEKVHLPIYDAFVVAKDKTFGASIVPDPRVIRFFTDITGKTKLETNLQAPGVLPSENTFESRALRVVTSAVTKPDPLPDGVDDAAEFRVRFLEDVIYHSVITLLVGEKVMIEMPTFWFPAGAGVSPGNGAGFGHGEPDPLATFRFSEPVEVGQSQAFRVEMLFPDDIPDSLKNIDGPLRIWVVLDGYLTRDVQ
jgi:hypothetical protein